MKVLIFALGLLFALEGLLYALAPNFMKKMAAMILTTAEDQIRQSGVIAAAFGAVLIFIAARLFG
ncbi:MAG: DUF2065 domain-containing protein [Ponticaulis sp.]|nr:DUF2065 domain-containing protein [Ponticaulis sp.]